MLLGLWLASLLTYGAFVAWPMRIWHRELSPHTHLVGTFGVDRAGALRYVVIVAVLFALYAGALWCGTSLGTRLRLWQVLAGASVLYVVLLPTHPLTSADIFNYMSSARVQWVHGDNPLTTPPLAYPDDAFYHLVFFWREVPSPYGPLWSLLTVIPHALGGGSEIGTVLAYKALAVAFMLAAGLLAGLTAGRLRSGQGAIAALALTWNPLVVWHITGNGHNDAVMVALLALAAALLAYRRPGPATLAFTASALIKFATVLIVPLALVWWCQRRETIRWRSLAPWLAASLVLVVAAYAPYWAGRDTFRTALNEGSYFVVSGPAALRGALNRYMALDHAEAVAAWTGRAAYLAAYAAILRRELRRSANGEMWEASVERLLLSGSLVLLAYLLLAATYFAPWYLIWPLTLAAMLPWRTRLLLPLLGATAGAMSILLWATWARSRWADDALADWYPMHLLSFLCVAGSGAAPWIWVNRRDRRRSASERSADVHAPVLNGEIAGTGVER